MNLWGFSLVFYLFGWFFSQLQSLLCFLNLYLLFDLLNLLQFNIRNCRKSL